MAAVISNVIGKSLVAGCRLTGYSFGLVAAAGLAQLGFRAVSAITPNWNFIDTAAQFAKNWHVHPISDSDKKQTICQIMGKVAAFTLLAFVVHEAACALEGPAPKIYNSVLSCTPIRVLDDSIIKSVMEMGRNFNVRDLFVVS